MRPVKSRKLILIRSDLLEKVSQITAREGKTMYSFTNEVFEQVLKAYEMNANLQDVVEFFTLMQIEKDAGTALIPVSVLEYMMNKLYKENEKELLEKWYEAGQWFGKYNSSRFLDREPLDVIEKLMTDCLRNLTNCSVVRKDDGVKIVAMAPHFSLEQTKTLSGFLEGILNSLNYVTHKNDSLKGIIILEFRKVNKS